MAVTQEHLRPVEAATEPQPGSHQEAARAVVQLANTDDSFPATEETVTSAGFPPDFFKPKHFRDHTNPYTMKMPDSWGSSRRT